MEIGAQLYTVRVFLWQKNGSCRGRKHKFRESVSGGGGRRNKIYACGTG